MDVEPRPSAAPRRPSAAPRIRSQDTASTPEKDTDNQLPDPVTHPSKPPDRDMFWASKYPLYEYMPEALQKATHFFGDTIPRQIYLHLLLRVPALYFTRITRVFEDAELSMRDIEQMRNSSEYAMLESVGPMGDHFYHSYPTLARFKVSWDEFVDSVTTEWQVQNVVSVLLLGAVLAELSIDSIESDPVTRTAALLSLVCALMSLLYGCIYMAQFGAMKKLYKAASWAEEAQRSRTDILWNVWVFLAMPTVWLLWSTLAFVASIISYTWRAGSTVDEHEPLSPGQAMIPRIVVSIVLVLGLLYLVCILRTLYRYGAKMENAWRANFRHWRRQAQRLACDPYLRYTDPYARKSPEPHRRPRSRPPRRKTWYGRPHQHGESDPLWSPPEGPEIPRGRPASQPNFYGAAEFPDGADRRKRIPDPAAGSRGLDRRGGSQIQLDPDPERHPYWLDEERHGPEPDFAGPAGLRQLLARPRDEPSLITERELLASFRFEPTSATRTLMTTDGTIDDRAENTDDAQSIEDTGGPDTKNDQLDSPLESSTQSWGEPIVSLVTPSVLDVLESPLGPFGSTLRSSTSGWIPRIFDVPPPPNLSIQLPAKYCMVYGFHESILTLSINGGALLINEHIQIDLEDRDWKELFHTLSSIWTGCLLVSNLSEEECFRVRLDTIKDLVLCYNTVVFRPRGLELFLFPEPITMERAYAISESIDIPEDAVARPERFWVIYVRALSDEEGEVNGSLS